MPKKVKCSHAGKKRCEGESCPHFAPHEEFMDLNILCTTRAPCWVDDVGGPIAYHKVVCRPISQQPKRRR